jgi:DNA-binding transcriptional LysR family regulator
MDITLRQLEVFLAVARAGSFRRAAEALHLSQPALSQHVGELERVLGVRLLDRVGRRSLPTEAGRIFAEHAARVFATLAGAREAAADLAGLRRGSLQIGASTTPGIYVLPAAMARFERRHPGTVLSLTIANSAAIEERIRANELDLGVVGGHALRPGEECVSAGLVDELVLTVPPGHPWAARRRVPPGWLAEQRLLVREEGSSTRQVTERALQRAGARPGPVMELGHTEAIKQAVMAGLGVAFVSVHAVRGEVASGRLHALRLEGSPIRRHFHVIHHPARALGRSARAFVDLLEAGGLDAPARRTRRFSARSAPPPRAATPEAGPSRRGRAGTRRTPRGGRRRSRRSSRTP